MKRLGLVWWLVLLGCGDDNESARPRDAASLDANALDASTFDATPLDVTAPDPYASDAYTSPEDPACARFGIRFAAGSDDGTEPLTDLECVCPARSEPLWLGLRCQYGRCVQTYDCGAICEPGAANEALAFGACIAEFACREHGECGLSRCIRGRCESGDSRSDCGEDAECLTGLCVRGRCVSGDPGSACEGDPDCADGARCLGTPRRCTRGALGEPCATFADCREGMACNPVLSTPEGFVSLCVPRTAIFCDTDVECPEGGTCIGGLCDRGAPGAPCANALHCLEGECQRAYNEVVGTCAGRVVGATCRHDRHCDSGRCTKWQDEDLGLCTSGDMDAPCATGLDCTRGRCDYAPGPYATCDRLGERCGPDRAGVCANRQCQYGRCAN